MKEIKRKTLANALIQALGAGVALTVAATAAHAQQAQRVEKIEVTGSNIKRVDQETVAPVEIITRDQIERTGQPTVADVLRNIPANSGGSFSESFTNSFAPGIPWANGRPSSSSEFTASSRPQITSVGTLIKGSRRNVL